MEEKKTEKKEDSKKNDYVEIPVGKFFGSMRKNPWIISTFVLGIAFIAIVVLVYSGKIGGQSVGKTINGQVAAEKAVQFINENYPLTEKISLVSVEKKDNFYEATISYQGREIPIYLTLDGKYLLNGQPVNLDEKPKIPSNPREQQAQKEIPKTDKPKVDLYVMSFCPFGNRAENTMYPVYKLLKDKVEWNVRYIMSGSGENIRSLHGQKEVDGNLRELCVMKNYGADKFWAFMVYINDNCGGDGSCWEAALTANGMDKTKITSCFNSADKVKMLEAEVEATEKAGASGSPTMFINGVETPVVYQYGNAEAYKKAICDAFTTPPAECSQTLSANADATAQGGSC